MVRDLGKLIQGVRSFCSNILAYLILFSLSYAIALLKFVFILFPLFVYSYFLLLLPDSLIMCVNLLMMVT